MVIMRNPFRKQDENVRPSINGSTVRSGVTDTPAISIHVAQRPPIEYKLSGESAATLVKADGIMDSV